MDATLLAADAFGDRFDLNTLPLPRKAEGYAVQLLDTDRLLDKESGEFFSVRDRHLNALHNSFDSAHAAASAWVCRCLSETQEHKLAIVPAAYDVLLERHILIYGVLCAEP